MQDLHLVGFTKDHRHLIFSTRKDAKSGGYVVPVDDDLLEAVDEVMSHRAQDPDHEDDGADTAPPSPPRVESQLSVREVQARLRAGDPAARIARDAGVDAAWVERFAQPIRAEQRRVVDRALAVPLSRARAGESAVPLRRAIAAAMAERNVDFTAEGFEAAWSARLIGGSEWAVTFEFPNRGRTRVLEWEFDIGSGTLTTSDRFASQLAFVETASDLPPADATVGAEATRVGSQMSRGPLTSGGLARPGSGRVTEPSTSATSLPPVVRSAGTSGSASQAHWPRPATPSLPPERPSAPRAATPPPAMAPRRSPAERRPETRPTPSIEPTPRPAAPPTSAAKPTSATPPTVDRPRQPMRTESSRPASAPVPPRRPAPVAAPTNATRSHTRRPVPEIAPRMPVVVDADASDAAADRRVLIEDEYARRAAVPSHPPGGRGESVVILRAVDEPTESDPSTLDTERDDADGDDAAWDEIDDSEEDWLDDDDWDDEGEAVDADDADLEADDGVDDDIDDALDVEADEEDDVAEVYDETEDVDAVYGEDDEVEIDDRDEPEDEYEFEDEDEDGEEEYGEEEYGDDDFDGADEDEHDDDLSARSASDVEDVAPDDHDDGPGPESRPEATSARRSESPARPRTRRLVARPEPQPDVADRTDERVPAPRPQSSVQFRPGSATQAGSGRSDANPNGRDDMPAPADEPDLASTDPSTDEPARPRRRRRTEPLRAR